MIYSKCKIDNQVRVQTEVLQRFNQNKFLGVTIDDKHFQKPYKISKTNC